MNGRLKILHIAKVGADKTKGVYVVVPEHIITQSVYAETFLLNMRDEVIDNITNQLVYKDKSDLKKVYSSFGKPDIAVFHEVYVKEFPSVASQLRSDGIPYIIVPHGSLTDVSQKKSGVKKALANMLMFNRFIKNSEALQCLSQDEMASTDITIRKFVSPNGVYMPEKKKTEFIQSDGMKFIYIGRLEYYYKGLDLLIEAAKICKDFLEKNNCLIYIYGPDKDGRYEHIKSLIEQNGVQSVVKLNHAVFGKEKEAELLNSDCFIQTSRSEGMPLGVLEALSRGLPCLVTYGTRFGDIVKKNDLGWACDADAGSIASAVKKAYDERYTLINKSEKAIDYIKSHYEWSVVSSKTVSIYNDLIHKEKAVALTK